MIIQNARALGSFAGPVLVIGTGSIGARHLAALRGLCASPPIALPVRTGREGAPELAFARVVSSFAEAAALNPVAAIIATDTSRHLEDAAKCLEAGCHVLVEKPLSATLSGVRALIDLGRSTGRRVHVACCLRFHQTVTRFRELLPLLGRVHDVRIECQSYLPD